MGPEYCGENFFKSRSIFNELLVGIGGRGGGGSEAQPSLGNNEGFNLPPMHCKASLVAGPAAPICKKNKDKPRPQG